MGAAVTDFNKDGWIDLYVTNWGKNQLLKNNGDGTFSDITDVAGVASPQWGIAQPLSILTKTAGTIR